MQALDVLDSPLAWETERQNRVHQAAIEQKKKQARAEEPRREPQLNADRNLATPSQAAVVVPQEWNDKVRAVPDMRSALIPLDEETEGQEWSLPFSLLKADMEPWQSFYKGYLQSRIFLETSSRTQGPPGEQQIDYPVRALFELKQANITLILEPAVRINGLVEYHDLQGELSVCRDPVLAKALFKVANEVHEKQLNIAIQRGRTMGNALHDALMGEGHANLIRAWEKIFKRKPSIDELHLMLTTGRVKIAQDRRPQAPAPESKPAHPKPSAPPPRSVSSIREAALEQQREPQTAKPAPPPKAISIVVDDAPETLPFTEPPRMTSGRRKMLWTLLHATIACAALVAFIYFA